MTTNTQLHTEARGLTERPKLSTEQFVKLQELGREALALADRDSREVPIEQAKQILSSVELSQNMRMWGETVLTGVREETGGLRNLKRRTLNRFIDAVKSENPQLPQREKIGQFHNDPQFH